MGVFVGEDALFGEERVLERGRTELHYWVTGPEQSPAVVLSHGASMDHRLFEHQIDALSADYRVITWDASGHGRSKPIDPEFSIARSARDLIGILDDSGVAEAVLVGHSLGGMISQELLLQQAERVRGLAVIGASCITLPLNTVERLTAPLSGPLLRMFPDSSLKKTISKRSFVTPEGQAYGLEACSQLDRKEFLAVWAALLAGLRPDPEYRIDLPVLLIRGEHDKLGNISRHMPLWEKRDPDCRYITVPGSSHTPNYDRPDAVNTLIREFLQHVEGQAKATT